MHEFVAEPPRGRVFRTSYAVRLGDAGADGALRLDSLLRYLQDVAADDWADLALDSDNFWVVRHSAVHKVADRWPVFKQVVELRTWVSGVGAAWAERRTDVHLNGSLVAECCVLAVQVAPSGLPARLDETFLRVYDATGGRKVSGRVDAAAVSPSATRSAWSVRVAALDVAHHVNNAATWQALSEVAPEGVTDVHVTHHGAIAASDAVTLAWTDDALWLECAGEVRVAATFS